MATRPPPYCPFAFAMTKHSSKWPYGKKPAASRLTVTKNFREGTQIRHERAAEIEPSNPWHAKFLKIYGVKNKKAIFVPYGGAPTWRTVINQNIWNLLRLFHAISSTSWGTILLINLEKLDFKNDFPSSQRLLSSWKRARKYKLFKSYTIIANKYQNLKGLKISDFRIWCLHVKNLEQNCPISLMSRLGLSYFFSTDDR